MADVALQDEKLHYYQQYSRDLMCYGKADDDQASREAWLFNETLADYLKRAQREKKTLDSKGMAEFVDRLASEVREVVRLNIVADRFSISAIVSAMKRLEVHYADWAIEGEETGPYTLFMVYGMVPLKSLSIVERELISATFAAEQDEAGYLGFQLATLRRDPTITDSELYGWVADEYKFMAWERLEEVLRKDGKTSGIIPLKMKLKRWGAHLFGGGLENGRI